LFLTDIVLSLRQARPQKLPRAEPGARKRKIAAAQQAARRYRLRQAEGKGKGKGKTKNENEKEKKKVIIKESELENVEATSESD